MTEAARQPEFVNTLKTFNNAIVTIRLYPANVPQITNAVERGYKAVKQHLRQYGNFTIGLRGTEPELCGEVVPAETVQSISNLIVFRQLDLLEAEQFVLTPGLDRPRFKKILELFSAKVDQIKEQGGGRTYSVKLGVDRYFPELETVEQEELPGPRLEGVTTDIDGMLQVRREFIDVLLGREKRTAIVSELQTILTSPAEGAPVLVAAVSGIIEGLLQKKVFAESTALSLLMINCRKLVSGHFRKDLLDHAAVMLLKRLKIQAAAVLMSQEIPQETGTELREALLRAISLEQFGDVIRELRIKVSQMRLTQSSESRQLQFLTRAVDRLLATPKGKQYLGQEKARNIIEAGEKARKAKRVQSGVKLLLKGNSEVLQSEEFNIHLPFVLQKMEADGMEKEVATLLNLLSSHFVDGNAASRERIIRTLSQISENLVLEKNWERLLLIAEPLLIWLRSSADGDFIYEKVCLALHALMGQSLRSGEDRLGDRILSLFYQIRSGKLRRPASVRAIIERVQDKKLDKELLNHLLEQCLENPSDEVVSRRLILQGPIASRFLVDRLIRAEHTHHRIKMIDMLTYGEQFLPPILIEKLVEPMPWYGKRNLLKLLAETGSQKHIETVYPYLQHEDLRVQREAFTCLYKISGNKRKKALLQALVETSETMKLQVVRALLPFGDREVVEGLSQLLYDHKYYSEDFRDTLLSNVCLAIARCTYPDSEKALQKFLELKGTRAARRIGSKVWDAVQDALKLVAENQQGEKQLKAWTTQLGKSPAAHPAGEPRGEINHTITGLPEEKRIRELAANGEVDSARMLLLDLIERVARLRRFSQAEQLREWLIEIDSFALTDIIRAAEIIEEEKYAAIDKVYLDTWADLYDILTTDEFSTLYHALEQRRYRNEEILMRKGTDQTGLFFINSGRVKLYYREKDQEVLIKTMQQGEVLGAGSFFDASVWTYSLAALGKCDVAILQLEQLEKWKDKFPALESKLQDFCRKFESVDQFFRLSDKDRRRYTRHEVREAHVSTNLLDSEGKSTGVSTKGELADISRGGVSFFMRVSKKGNARLLLGRSLRIALALDETGGKPMVFTGQIVSVRAHHVMDNEYSVHVEFAEPLDSAELQRVLQLL